MQLSISSRIAIFFTNFRGIPICWLFMRAPDAGTGRSGTDLPPPPETPGPSCCCGKARTARVSHVGRHANMPQSALQNGYPCKSRRRVTKGGRNKRKRPGLILSIPLAAFSCRGWLSQKLPFFFLLSQSPNCAQKTAAQVAVQPKILKRRTITCARSKMYRSTAPLHCNAGGTWKALANCLHDHLCSCEHRFATRN